MLEPRNNSPVFVIAHLSLSLTHTHTLAFIYLACLYCSFLYMLDIFVLYCIYAWDCLLILVFNQGSHSSTSTLNLEEF